jgi:hypothetical protein
VPPKFKGVVFKTESLHYGKQHFLVTKEIQLTLLKEVIYVNNAITM